MTGHLNATQEIWGTYLVRQVYVMSWLVRLFLYDGSPQCYSGDMGYIPG
jgi:hypothetical protein